MLANRLIPGQAALESRGNPGQHVDYKTSHFRHDANCGNIVTEMPSHSAGILNFAVGCGRGLVLREDAGGEDLNLCMLSHPGS